MTTQTTALAAADLAVAALHHEIDLTPKPGLVDLRGPGAHDDMTAALLHASADCLHAPLEECAAAGRRLPVGTALRAEIGAIGRAGEAAMLTITRGVNTHRGALWSLGLLCAAIGTGAERTVDVVAAAAELARISDPAAAPAAAALPGALARRRYGVAGAIGQAQSGFPAVTRYGLPALRERGAADALISLIAHLDDTCLLHRGGARGLADVQQAARAVLRAGGPTTSEGGRRFAALDRLCATRGLSPGGSGDLLAVTLFLHDLDGVTPCRH
jgi:triphosphoribosyl-dephospho-CoA synthase